MRERRTERLLILTKTYPSPSSKYRETTCVAALTEAGDLVRLFPVPFRLLDESKRFPKWSWIEADIRRAHDDKRPESYKLDAGSIKLLGATIGTKDAWLERMNHIRAHIFSGFAELEEARVRGERTLGFVGPVELEELQITPTKTPDWTPEEVQKLRTVDLFDSDEIRNRPTLRKIPFGFHYRYRTPANETMRHMMWDWEIGALYWNCVSSHHDAWEAPFRQRLMDFMKSRDLLLLLGTIHRFPTQWIIAGIAYPPKGSLDAGQQRALL